MKEKLIEHLKEQGFEFNIEPDGDETLVEIINAEDGEVHTTLCFDKAGNLRDIWSIYKEKYLDYKAEVEEQLEDAKLGQAVKQIAELFI